MGKTYSVDLPITQNRPLKYTRAERQEFEKRFRHFGLPGMKDILFERVFPVRPNPAEDNKMTPTGGGDIEAQVCLIWLGVRHNNPKFLTEEKVGELLDVAIMQDGRSMIEFVAEAVNAVMASGVLGFVRDIAVVEDEGKAPETPAA